MAATEARLTEAEAQNTVRAPKPTAGKTTSRQRRAPQHAARPSEERTGASRLEAAPADAHVSGEDRLALFVDTMTDTVLPDLPQLPGYHVCWLTTNNSRDPIAKRLRAGYELLRVSDFPEYANLSLKTGDYQGVIGVNEMVAAKVPEVAYQRAMAVLHHERPLDEESKLRTNIDMLRENAARQKSAIVEEGDGTADLGKGTSAPRFAS